METKCEECGKPLVAGDDIVYTDDMRRLWHNACFNETLLPVDQWPVEKKL